MSEDKRQPRSDGHERSLKKGFKRRYYSGLRPFWKDLKYLLSRRAQIREAMGSDTLPPDFRERLMLAVTEVNGCRYCRTFHVGQARQAGVSTEEITQYLQGLVPEDTPEDQKLAVCYAQHWAETNADPDPEIKDQIREVYGEGTARAIDIALRMIRMGNLLGNTADFLLYLVSFGRWGGAVQQPGSGMGI
ncbi:MAG: carboxymuconolactone decarboxylase family protein [Anaerolineales bacterium]|jgi:AhpD family alkylhydroperoxidase